MLEIYRINTEYGSILLAAKNYAEAENIYENWCKENDIIARHIIKIEKLKEKFINEKTGA